MVNYTVAETEDAPKPSSKLWLNFKRKWNRVCLKSGLLDLAKEFRRR